MKLTLLSGVQVIWPLGRQSGTDARVLVATSLLVRVQERCPTFPRHLLQARELTLPLISCSTRESGPSTSSEKHSRADPVDRVWVSCWRTGAWKIWPRPHLLPFGGVGEEEMLPTPPHQLQLL